MHLGTETIKRGASPPENISENNNSPTSKTERTESNLSIVNGSKKQQSHDKLAQKSTDETKKEDNTSGPSSYRTSSNEKLYNNPSPKTLSSCAYDKFTIQNTFTTAANSSSTRSSLDNTNKKTNENNTHEISFYEPINYLDNPTTSVLTTKASATMVKHKITNNFKLPPFPVYVPSTNFSSSTLNLHSSTDLGSNNETSNKSKETLEASSVSPKINSTSISHLSSVSSTTSPSGLNATTLGRFNPYLYQTESILSNNSNNVNMTTSMTSSNINNEKTASYTSPLLDQKTSYNKVCSSATMSKLSSEDDSYVNKLSHGIVDKENSYSHKYNTAYYSNVTTTNNLSSNGTSTYTTSASDNIYRVQYSATNPFLDPLDLTGASQTGSNGLTSVFSNATVPVRSEASNKVSEIAKKFEKLDFNEDLK